MSAVSERQFVQGESQRAKIIAAIDAAGGAAKTADISKASGIQKATVLYHLKQLRGSKVVRYAGRVTGFQLIHGAAPKTKGNGASLSLAKGQVWPFPASGKPRVWIEYILHVDEAKLSIKGDDLADQIAHVLANRARAT